MGVRVHARGLVDFGLKRVRQFRLEDREKLFKDYFKFIIVREPMERLYSGYHDKLKSNLDEKEQGYKRYYLRRIGTKIIKMFRPDAPNYVLKSGRSVKFDEFLGFLNKKMNNRSNVDPHWRPFHRIINPCAFEFDFIAKQETMYNDSKFILSKLFGSENIKDILPKQNVRAGDKKSVLDRVEHPRSFEEVVKHYAPDFEVYGYDMEKYLQ